MCKINIKELEERINKTLQGIYEREAKELKELKDFSRDLSRKSSSESKEGHWHLFARNATGPSGPTWKMSTEKYKSTKYGSKGKAEGKHIPFYEEAVVNVWHEKDLLNIFKMRPGHAALKLSMFSEQEKKNIMVKYISWWPGDAAGKFSPADPGSRVLSTRQDRDNEMTGDFYINLLLKLQFIRTAWSTDGTGKLDPDGREDFRQLAGSQWRDLSDEQQKIFKEKYNCEENFAHLEKSKIKPNPDQKFIYKPANPVKVKKVILNKEGLSETKKMLLEDGNVSLPEIIKAMRADFLKESDRPIEETTIYKQPFVRVYVPCSCLPAPLVPGEVYMGTSPWGLSIDAMKLKFRSYEAGFRNYKMKGFEGNCIGAVWECLKSGLADVITDKFRTSKGLVNTLAHLQSLVPSDAIGASIALSDEIIRLNLKQRFLDVQAYKYKEGLAALKDQYKCSGEEWRNYVRIHKSWTTISSDTGIRPSALASIDKLVAQYEKNEKLLGKTDEDCVQDVLKLEAVWESRYVAVKEIIPLIEDIHKAQARLEELQDRIDQGGATQILLNLKKKYQQEIDKYQTNLNDRLKRAEPQIKAWEEELGKYEKVRRSRAGILVKLHDAVFAYVYNNVSSKPSPTSAPDKRYLATLLLGQFVCWLFAEVMHDNLTVRFHNITAEGLLFSMQEKEKALGKAFPNLDIHNRYTGKVAYPESFRKGSVNRDRLVNLG